MKRALIVTVLALTAAGLAPAAAAAFDRSDFRYVRQVVPLSAGEPVVLEPDGELYERSAPSFRDLRIVDRAGAEIPWRRTERPPVAAGVVAVPALNSGRQGRHAVALFDLGPGRSVRDRIELEIPDADFVGRAIVSGADNRLGPFTRLSATGIYDIPGAFPARSTVAVFPPSDFRYLEVRAAGPSAVVGATVSGPAERPQLVRRTVRSEIRREAGRSTIITLDLGSRRVPLDELRITADTQPYERPVAIFGSNDRRRFLSLGAARIFRFLGSSSAPIPLQARHRFVVVRIDNGDDSPLRGIDVTAWSESRALVLEGGHPGPFTIYFGNQNVGAPRYDFARLPASVLGIADPVPGRLLRVRGNPEYEPPEPPESSAAGHPELITAALALAALVVAAVGVFVLRRPT